MTSLAMLVTAVFTATLLLPAAAAHASCHSETAEEACTDATDGGFGVGIGEKGESQTPRRGVKPVNGPAPIEYVEKRYVPTCTGNTVDNDGVLCNAAVTTCPTEGDVRFWVYTREVTIATGAATDWQRVSTPPTVCLGPDDPVIDPAVAIPALDQREFKRVVVLKGVADVSPRPETLVNVATRFRTSTPEQYDIPLSLLGQSVVITARAERWTWFFGDGHTATTAARGTAGRVEHEYREAATREAYVVIEWSGRFRINGGPSRTILGTATTTGDPASIVVREARTELVRD